MDTKRSALTVGLVAVAAVAGKFALKALGIGAGVFLASSTLGFMGTEEVERQMRAGFEEVSPEWRGFVREWQDSSEATFRKWGARVVVEHLNEMELREMYALRGEMFERIAPDPTQNGICGVDPSGDVDFERLGLERAVTLTGRAFGRRHAAEAVWQPPIDLETDQQGWLDFARFLDASNSRHVLDAFIAASEGQAVPDEQFCRAQARLYSMAAATPDQRVGRVRLLDMVRSIEYLGVQQP